MYRLFIELDASLFSWLLLLGFRFSTMCFRRRVTWQHRRCGLDVVLLAILDDVVKRSCHPQDDVVYTLSIYKPPYIRLRPCSVDNMIRLQCSEEDLAPPQGVCANATPVPVFRLQRLALQVSKHFQGA